MTCTAVRAQLPLLLYGDLPPDQAAAAEAHLAGCAECRAELAGLRQVRGLLDQAPPVPMVAVDLEAIYRRTAADRARQAVRWQRAALALGAAAAASLFLAVGLNLEVRVEAHQFVVRWGSPSPLPEPPAPAPPPPPAQFVRVETGEGEKLRVLSDLIRAVSHEIEARDAERQLELTRLTQQVRDLQRLTAQQRAETERDLRALYTAYFGPKGKGATP